jgi:UDP:flavonoid glycosyltransferase YjiC (YdhE family)
VSRILLAWELGSNLGHLSRLLPLARRLTAHGHGVLAVVRDLTAAAQTFGPLRIPFIQAPRAKLPQSIDVLPANYADLLSYHGWADVSALWAVVQAWVTVLRMAAPQVMIIDHAPTALLAARITGTACVIVGTGFEIPPAEEAIRSEAHVLENANRVLTALRGAPLSALSDLFAIERRWMSTFPELDHYGPQPRETYIGPINQIVAGDRVEWPSGFEKRVFAYLRADTPCLRSIVPTLKDLDAAVICYAPSMPRDLVGTLSRTGLVVSPRPFELKPLLEQMSLCVSYSPAATVSTTLLNGIPQLLSPSHLETELTASRVQNLGAGLTLRADQSESDVRTVLNGMLRAPGFGARAAAFAEKYRKYNPAREADMVVSQVEALASRA